MTLGRAGLGLILAIAAGWAFGTDDAKTLLRPRPDDHSVTDGDDQQMIRTDPSARRTEFVDHLAADFFFMGRFVVIGAALAAAMQTVIPQASCRASRVRRSSARSL